MHDPRCDFSVAAFQLLLQDHTTALRLLVQNQTAALRLLLQDQTTSVNFQTGCAPPHSVGCSGHYHLIIFLLHPEPAKNNRAAMYSRYKDSHRYDVSSSVQCLLYLKGQLRRCLS